MKNTEPKHTKVKSRNEAFVDKTLTKIWQEQASDDNPYIASSAHCHGYDIFELMKKRSFIDVLFLMFRGELPNKNDSELLESLMIGLINPGPRHPATRAAMNVGVGKSDVNNILPIGSAVLGGELLGGLAVEAAMRFYRKNQKKDVKELAQKSLNEFRESNIDGLEETDTTMELLPGFGCRFGGVDCFARNLALQLRSLGGAGPALIWGIELANELEQYGIGLLIPGLAAAVYTDLGFQPKVGVGLFQFMGAPGLLAHGFELASKPITAMPYVKDQDYVIET